MKGAQQTEKEEEAYGEIGQGLSPQTVASEGVQPTMWDGVPM
jgi:hypothetical protein